MLRGHGMSHMSLNGYQRASGGMFSSFERSRTQRFYIKGSLFFLLLKIVNATSDSSVTTMESISTTQSSVTVNSVFTASEQMTSMSTSASQNTLSYITTVTSSYTENLSSTTNASTVPTSVNTDSVNTSSLTGNNTQLSCPAFTCTTNCYIKFLNETANPCPSTTSFCELIKQDMSYSTKCSVSCGMSCRNATVSNCSLDCCNTTNCLNYTLFVMSNAPITTVASTKSTTTPTTIKVTAPPTPANNGKKCHSIKCEGTVCYKNNNALMYCPLGQDYCMLNKTTAGAIESWQGGCSTDCRKGLACSSGVMSCYLECCNATSTSSCLKLTGDLNMPSSATRGPYAPALPTASLLLLWVLKVLT